jgi:hypothetical protein
MDNPSEPINDGTYFDSLEGVIEKSKVWHSVVKRVFIPDADDLR